MKRCKKLSSNQKSELQNLIKLGADAKEVRRAQAILFLDSQANYETIETLTQFKERAVLAFRQRYLKDGLKGIEHKRKGKPKRLLCSNQRNEVLNFLTTTTPKDHGYDIDFWSTSVLAHLIQEKYGVVYKSKKPFYLLFEEAKFTFHKPGQVYEKRDEVKVEDWKTAIKPKLEEAFEDPDTIILCEDEMVLSSTTTFQKIWLKKGEYPKIEVSNTKKNKSIYGFLNIKTAQEHGFIKDWQNMHITVEVLKEIRKIYPHKNLLLFWDGAGWHRGSAVQNFIKEDAHIEIVYFPPYSPEQNPQEHVWKAGRAAITHNTFIPDIEKAANDFVDYLNSSSFPYKFLHLTARL
jgi:transposase